MDAKRLRRWLLQGLAPLAAAAALLVAFLAVDRSARQYLRGHERYALAVADITCEAPPGLTRADFLDEVQYLGDLPGRLSLLDDGLVPRLAAAFARHPWVARVDEVVVAPGREVRVRLTFRTPVLAVQGRAVDGDGVLLPQSAILDGLPVLRGKVAAPAGPAGAPWGDDRVAGAARTAALVLPHRQRLPVREFHWAGEDLILDGPEQKQIRWGRPPGAEKAGEESAERKLERLLRSLQ